MFRYWRFENRKGVVWLVLSLEEIWKYCNGYVYIMFIHASAGGHEDKSGDIDHVITYSTLNIWYYLCKWTVRTLLEICVEFNIWTNFSCGISQGWIIKCVTKTVLNVTLPKFLYLKMEFGCGGILMPGRLVTCYFGFMLLILGW